MHTYYSALPFTPHNTRLYHLYEQETSHSIAVLQGLSPAWTSCLSAWFFFERGRSILRVSLDGMWLAAGRGTKIMILDAQTTASQCQISLTDGALCLAFSPTESTLAIVTPKSLELWNTTTGINQKTQMLRSDAVDYTFTYAVAFSSQGQYLLLSIDQGLHLHHGTDASELSVLSTDWSHKAIIFISNDQQVITGSEGYIHFFTLSGNQLSEIQERRIFNGAGVLKLVLRHDGKRLASSGDDGTIRIYDLPSRSPIATLRRPGSLYFGFDAIAYHPTEEELAVGNDNCVVLCRQTETSSDWMQSIHSYHESTINGIAYCQNGTQMYASTTIGDVTMWTTTVTQAQEPPKHTMEITCHTVNQPTSLLATGSDDLSIILWNLTTGDYWKALLSHETRITSLVFSDDGVLLASGDHDCMTIVWDVASGSLLHRLGLHDSCKNVLAFSEDNAHLTTRSHDHKCFVWELKSGQMLERRDLDMSVDLAHTTLYGLVRFDGWQTVVEGWHGRKSRKNCRYGLCRPPGEYRIIPLQFTPIVGDRAVVFCLDGRVLILDISRVMHVYTDPARQIEWDLDLDLDLDW